MGVACKWMCAQANRQYSESTDQPACGNYSNKML